MAAAPSRLAKWLSVVAFVIGAVAFGSPSVANADDVRDEEWHLGFLDIAKVQRITRGEGVTVAVLDTGIDFRHSDLKGALLKGHTFAGGRDDGWGDVDGHGTAMASLIAGRGHGPGHQDGVLGIAPGAKLLPVRTSTGGLENSRSLPQGIKWAADHGADVVSISQGDVDGEGLKEATEYALGKGAVVVAGVGNTNQGYGTVAAPAMYPGVVAVSATDQAGKFANVSVGGHEVVLSAPGTEIMAAGSGKRGKYGAGTGTSDSTAIVSGVAALIKSKYPDLDAANIVNRLIATADDKGPHGRDSQYGFGIVNPVKALTGDVPKTNANPLIKPPHSSAKPAESATDAATGGTSSTLLLILSSLALIALAGICLALIIRNRSSGRCTNG